ncbi:hypothetical protein GCM10010123_01280 [Pilimelia anulata]|uniref:D-serine dehydratase-like domain-containing protein n=1 Tax=Pilimelia anulata TaxID=53371 RepID=A0A8J3F739_9ACTN|nr:alanine racemase [Pilimelia anulata]GGJ75039.1 hypothetical protein GCM10010123_01280 [Pilimelia anulata]
MEHPPARSTPYAVVDTDTLDRNLAAMATLATTRGFALRPHAKTHKSPEIARRQLARGASGLTVATISEAEVFADAGCTDLFIAYPILATGPRATRLRALAERTRLRVGVDSAEGARALAAALAGTAAEVLVEVDSGHRRSGVTPDRAGAVAAAAAEAGLPVRGVFTFPGHGYAPGGGAGAAADEAAALDRAAAALRAAGLDCAIRSGGSTPTAAATAAGAVTELRPGVYALNDAQQLELGTCGPDELAFWLAASVVSRGADRVILDAGSKVLGADRPPWTTGWGRLPDHPGARVTALSEHHATVVWEDGAAMPGLGDAVRVVPNHVCSAVNLADELVVLSDGTAADVWPVTARGANT